MPIPQGTCQFNPKNAQDKWLMQTIAQKAKDVGPYLGGFADCKELSAWRQGKPLTRENHVFGYQIPLPSHVKLPIKFKCRFQDNEHATRDDIAKINQAAETQGSAGKILSRKMYGVLRSDDQACYIGGEQDVTSFAGTDAKMYFVIGSFVLKDWYVTVQSSATSDKVKSVDQLVDFANVWVTSVRTVNSGGR